MEILIIFNSWERIKCNNYSDYNTYNHEENDKKAKPLPFSITFSMRSL